MCIIDIMSGNHGNTNHNWREQTDRAPNIEKPTACAETIASKNGTAEYFMIILTHDLQLLKAFLFADDTTVSTVAKSPSVACRRLSNDSSSASMRATDWDMQFQWEEDHPPNNTQR